jgi:two-component system cell cycle sensor histidine kinase/response regulator CckA
MLKSLRDVPIGRKLLWIVMATTTAALLLAGASLLILDSVLFRAGLRSDLTALARVVGDSSTAALAFDDPRVASETLGALRARPHIVSACLYLPDGRIFARYQRRGAQAVCPPPEANEEARFANGALTVSRPVMLQGRRLGTLVLLYDLGQVAERRNLYGATLALILLASILFAFVLSSRLRRIITEPISRLLAAAASVSSSGDYSIRAIRDSGDELGILVDAFNRMLDRIQSRDAEVHAARNSLETTLHSIGDAVIAAGRDGRVVFTNPAARSLLRLTEEQAAGKPIDQVFRVANEYSHQPVESPVTRVLRDRAIAALPESTVLLAADGTRPPIEGTAAPIRQDGDVTGVVLVFRDLTEQRRAQQDAAFLAAIVESSEDAIIGKSPDGIIQTWNSGAERVYGYKAAEVIGRYMAELLPEDRRHEESAILERLRTGDRVVHFETMRVRKDGTQIDVSLTISPIRDKSGQLMGASHVARDITEQKRSAEQMRQTQKLESLGILAGGIAHDFNNLLTGILGNASLALDDTPVEWPARQAIEDVISACERAAQLSRQMLAYSGKGRFILEQIDLSERVRGILPLIRAAVPPHVELKLDLEEHLPPVEADAAQIQQLVMNVIINGAEAVPEGARGLLSISTRRQEVDRKYLRASAPVLAGELSPGPHVLFEVTDNGVGMDEATLARIFDPFFTTKFTGRGLGLSAVLGIVRGHHGSIQVTSAPGQGTTFRLLFPAAMGAPEPKAAAPAQASASPRGSGQILVVDDEEVVRNVARNTLERYGYTVLLAENGARGLDLYRHEPGIRCVVLDLTMPVMSGEEALGRMQAARGGVPIILSSGFNEAQALQRFQGKGLAGFLQKPYKGSALAQKVAEVLAKAPAAQAP